ncbi:hypothetical protein [Natranaerobius thermophilus]|uniref:Uncharacterized protein n=1 Tax=Natranaerobius thermophilus (strain ATCC BAA-1301 / DSM 18059 / JW/NM-WN-LF) TaxID=457570 RepID=B2A6M3_NATTJ|nr:hypothetical protein [Natranaerobius thermophilus]ACB85556.1 hypothetical protein Nther_1989 [Natranaerobius thermophilus JW/NM-WN-LF]
MSHNELTDKRKLELVFQNFKESKNIDVEKQERKAKVDFINNNLMKDQLSNFNEGTVRELVQLLWSFQGWTNKDYLVEEMLKSGLGNIRDALEFLIYSEKPIAHRFDYVKRNIRMMGAAAISEVLTHFDEDCAIWNRRAREGLINLGVPKNKLPSSTQISGKQYEDFCFLAKKVLDEIKSFDQEIQNFLDLNSLLFFLSNLDTSIVEQNDEEEFIEDFNHDYAIQQVAQLGDGLGFEVETEFYVAPGCRIDALWRSRIANLGIISYAFEVHRRGSRDSAILNLQRVIKQDSSIQKVIVVSTKKEIEIFKNEIASLGEEFRDAIGYLEVDELEKALEHLDSLKEVLNYAGLLKT